jgi:cytochrome c553
MTTRSFVSFTLLALVAGTAGFTLAPRAASASPVERGQYLVTAMGCNDCHTPWHLGPNGPEPDMARMLSGHPATMALPAAPTASDAWPVGVSASMTAWAGPWGTSYTANLTPDRVTGLGEWTANEFVAALRTGRHQGRGRQILPPMPWPMIRNLTDDDLKAVFAYLMSIPAIANQVPEPLPPVAPPAAK